jgi:hypothetical protein
VVSFNEASAQLTIFFFKIKATRLATESPVLSQKVILGNLNNLPVPFPSPMFKKELAAFGE